MASCTAHCRLALVAMLCVVVPSWAWAQSEESHDTGVDTRVSAHRMNGEGVVGGAFDIDAHHKAMQFQFSGAIDYVLTKGRIGLYLGPFGSVDLKRAPTAGAAESEGATHTENLWSGSIGTRLIIGGWSSPAIGADLPSKVDPVAVAGVSILGEYHRAIEEPETDQILTLGETVIAWVDQSREGSLGLGLRLEPGEEVPPHWYIPVSVFVHLGLLGQGKWSVPHTHRFVSEDIVDGEKVLVISEEDETASFLVNRPTFVFEFAWQWDKWTFTPELDVRGFGVEFGPWEDDLFTFTGSVSTSYQITGRWSWDVSASVIWEKPKPGEVHAFPQQDPRLRVLWGPSSSFSLSF